MSSLGSVAAGSPAAMTQAPIPTTSDTTSARAERITGVPADEAEVIGTTLFAAKVTVTG